MLMTVKATVGGDGSDDSTNIYSLELLADSGDFTTVMDDMWCDSTLLEGQYASSACYEDTLDQGNKLGVANGNNDWTNDATNTDNYCTETWSIATQTDSVTTSYAQRCVKMQFKGSRPFLTTDNGATTDLMFDIDLGYRKYSMTTGWIWQAQAADASTEPGLIHFDP